MADNRKPYTVTVSGIEHTMLLNAEDAERYGKAAVPVKQQARPANKSVTPDNKDGASENGTTETK